MNATVRIQGYGYRINPLPAEYLESGFTSNDALENQFDQLARHYRNMGRDQERFFKHIAGIKESAHPLDMLRRLSTNLVYHLSSLHGFLGGGYPLQGASLGGMLAMLSATLDLESAPNCALLNATGDMLSVDSLASFRKMALLKHATADGCTPNLASASLFLSNLPRHPDQAAFGEILETRACYFPEIPEPAHWDALYAGLVRPGRQPRTVVLYDNGVQNLGRTEAGAVRKHFPGARLRSYKARTGYTGTANSLLDVCLALEDPSVPPGSLVLVNGLGFRMGLGCVLFRKGGDHSSH